MVSEEKGLRNGEKDNMADSEGIKQAVTQAAVVRAKARVMTITEIIEENKDLLQVQGMPAWRK